MSDPEKLGQFIQLDEVIDIVGLCPHCQEQTYTSVYKVENPVVMLCENCKTTYHVLVPQEAMPENIPCKYPRCDFKSRGYATTDLF